MMKKIKKFSNISPICKFLLILIFVSADEHGVQHIKSQSMDDIVGDNKNSKICVIL